MARPAPLLLQLGTRWYAEVERWSPSGGIARHLAESAVSPVSCARYIRRMERSRHLDLPALQNRHLPHDAADFDLLQGRARQGERVEAAAKAVKIGAQRLARGLRPR